MVVVVVWHRPVVLADGEGESQQAVFVKWGDINEVCQQKRNQLDLAVNCKLSCIHCDAGKNGDNIQQLHAVQVKSQSHGQR